MHHLTQREFLNLHDQISGELQLVQKFNMLAGQCQDQDVKRLCQELASAHQKHAQMLMKHLESSPMM